MERRLGYSSAFIAHFFFRCSKLTTILHTFPDGCRKPSNRALLWPTPLAKLLLQAQHCLSFANRIREGGARKRVGDICREFRPALGVW
jgi:hypothetical protein